MDIKETKEVTITSGEIRISHETDSPSVYIWEGEVLIGSIDIENLSDLIDVLVELHEKVLI